MKRPTCLLRFVGVMVNFFVPDCWWIMIPKFKSYPLSNTTIILILLNYCYFWPFCNYPYSVINFYSFRLHLMHIDFTSLHSLLSFPLIFFLKKEKKNHFYFSFSFSFWILFFNNCQPKYDLSRHSLYT